MELAAADVERDHVGGTALEQHVGEAPGRRTDVEAVPAGRVDTEHVERVRQLLAAARDVRRRRRHRQLGRLVHLLPRLLVAGNEPGEDERLRLGAALGQPPLDQQHVEAPFQDVRAARPETIPARTEVSAGISNSSACARSAVWSASARAPSAPRSSR